MKLRKTRLFVKKNKKRNANKSLRQEYIIIGVVFVIVPLFVIIHTLTVHISASHQLGLILEVD